MSDLRRKTVRNAFFSGLQLPVNLAVGLLLPPFVLGFVGLRGYGSWTLALAVSSLVVLADTGVSHALVKYVAEFHARQDDRQLSSLISVAAVLCIAGSAALFALILPLRAWILRHLFGVEAVVAEDLDRIILVMLFTQAAAMTGVISTQVLVGLQRIDLASTVAIARVVANALVTVGLLLAGWGLDGMLTAWVVSSLGAAVASMLMARRLLPRFRPSWEGWRGHLRRLVHLGSADYATRSAVLLSGQIEKFALAYFVGVGAVGIYNLGASLVGQVRTLPAAVLPPFMPLASELHARRDRARLAILFDRGLKYLNLLAVVPFGFAIAFSPQIVHVWLGDGYPLVGTTIQILAVSAFVNLLTGPVGSLMVGMGQPRIAVQSCALLAAMSVSVTLLLAAGYGYFGVVAGSALAYLVASLYTLVRFPLSYGFPAAQTVRGLLGPWCLGAAVMAGAAAFYGFLSPSGRLQEGAALLLTGGLCVGAFLGLLWRTRLIGGEEADLVLAAMPAGWRGGR